MRISIELVPRSREALRGQLDEVAAFPSVNTVNLPHIPRFPVPIHEGCLAAVERGLRVIPHLRAVDLGVDSPLAEVARIEQLGISEVLAVTGDDPPETGAETRTLNSLGLIRRLRGEHPGLRVHAAFDPYRQGFQAELSYAEQKRDAGASGLFTQPFFDLRLMEAYAEQLGDVEVFWGVTSVLSERSMDYWRTRNRVVFPSDFRPTLEWNRAFARDALAFARMHGGNIYFMPIRASIADYLGGII